jgi:hypothetical protein
MMTASKRKKIKASEFDKAFEEGEVTEYLDMGSIKARYSIQRAASKR